MAKFEKKKFFEISMAKISKLEEKIKIPASTSFLYYQNLQVNKKSCQLNNFYVSYWILKVKIGHIFYCIENPIYLSEGPNFN